MELTFQKDCVNLLNIYSLYIILNRMHSSSYYQQTTYTTSKANTLNTSNAVLINSGLTDR